MKTIFLSCAMILLLMSPLAANLYIKVLSPQAGGASFCYGQSFMINWSGNVSEDATLTIALRLAGSAPDAAPALVIATGEANDGSYGPWTIPGTIAPGEYFIRVRKDDQTVVGDGRVFKIFSGPAIVVKPFRLGNQCCLGETYTIWWEKICAMQESVTIALRKEGSPTGAAPALVIATGEANDGKYTWRIHDDVPPGNYFIRVRTDDATVIGDGGIFSIKECADVAMIRVDEPNGSEEWEIPKPGYSGGAQHKWIKWSMKGWTGNVNLILMQNGKSKGLIAEHVNAHAYSFSWLIGKLANGTKVDPGIGFKVRIVRDYPGLVVPQHPLQDETDGDFSLISMK